MGGTRTQSLALRGVRVGREARSSVDDDQVEGAMPRYNIQVRTEKTIRESVVVERHDLTGLRVEVAAFVGELLKDHAEQIWIDEDWRIDATDEAGLILFTMSVFASNTSATLPYRSKR
jgi:hypothetical protein